MKSKGNKVVRATHVQIKGMSMTTLKFIIEDSLEKALVDVTNVTSDHRYKQAVYVVLDEINKILVDSM